jgi:hypothetical protein
MNIQTLLESANPYQSMQSDAARLVKKWEQSGLLEGLGKDVDRNNMSLILENQAKQLVTETSLTGTGGTFSVGTGEQWAGVALPLVRKVFGQLAAKEFVSVQPLNLPAGLVFFLDFQYGTAKENFALGNSLYGTTNTAADAQGGLYGAGKFGYSINQFSASVTWTIASASWADVNFDGFFSASAAAGTIKKLSVATSSISADLDLQGLRAVYVVSGAIADSDNLNAFTKLNGANVELMVTASTAEIGAPFTGSAFVTYFNKQTKDNARGDFEEGASFSTPNANSTTTIVLPEINVQLRSEAIVAKSRKLKAVWTPEFSQDLNAYQSLDAEAELTSILSEYISLEIDLEILDMLLQNAPTTEYWSAKVGNQINAGATGFDTNTTGVYYTQMSWFQTLGIKLQKISNKIHQKTLRGGANFMVVSPAVSTILESIPGFAADTDGDSLNMKYAFGVQKIGSLNSRYKVYKNPYMLENVILMGFRGNQFLETGAVYAPYIPLIMTPLVYDPNTFTPRKGIMTRYAKKMIRPEFYGKVLVADLHIV